MVLASPEPSFRFVRIVGFAAQLEIVGDRRTAISVWDAVVILEKTALGAASE